MSKAFTKESDEDEDLDLEPAESAPQVERNYITPAGLKRLRDEFAALWDVERPKLVETIAWAASNGDRSENGDYIYGKRRLREIDRRIRFLIEAARQRRGGGPAPGATTIACSSAPRSRIATGAGVERTVTIVGIDEVDAARGRVSWISPIAKALLKAREGDVVTLRTPLAPRRSRCSRSGTTSSAERSAEARPARPASVGLAGHAAEITRLH